MVRRPVIGVVGSEYVVPRFWGELPVVGAPTSYADAVLAAGGMPVVLVGRCATEVLDAVDALILTGGGDVDPARYGGDPAYGRDVDAARDQAEVELVLAAAAAGLPLLGVCRGLQVMVVSLGGTLTSDLGMTDVLPGVGHPVRTAPESLLSRLLGARIGVTSLHHQAVADPGPHWNVTARADDGVAEAIEWSGPTHGGRWASSGTPNSTTRPARPCSTGWSSRHRDSSSAPQAHYPRTSALTS